ncbi:fibronectin type III domain-containing protein [Nocardioides limicola]|uniref:fibronectin type III domain-containing protein n=1 Tax=Nocardioides limicola TaxID=2803368 RepID=UPI00193BF06F|nr:fibronectin type III domain-containing protein [Nocardioides sp. DJM-14]
MKRIVGVAVAGLVAGLLQAVAAPAAVAEGPLPVCTGGGPRPCVEQVLRNGAALSGGFGWFANATGGSAKEISFNATLNDAHDLGAGSLSDTWSVTLDVGTWMSPRVVHGKGRNVKINRLGGGRVQVLVQPVSVSGQCDGSGHCWEHWVPTDPSDNNIEWAGLLDLRISDFAQWTEVAQQSSFDGMHYLTNVAHTYLPPQVVALADGSQALRIEMENRRYRENNTLVRGAAELRIPHAFLRQVYDVPDPATMTGAGLAVGGVGIGGYSVTQDPAGGALLVRLSDITFPSLYGTPPARAAAETRTFTNARSTSVRRATVRLGVITPTRPKRIRANRVAPGRGVVRVGTPSKARGAKVRGYRARCRAVGSTHVRKARSSTRRIVVRQLRPGVAYRCHVRALSAAGPSRWSVKAARMPARP